MPSFLGKFHGNNLVLHKTVCDECNEFFGKYLDKPLARDSLEGIARYRFGHKPKAQPKYQKLSLKIDKGHRYEGLYVIPTFPSGGGKNDIEIDTQVEFFNSKTQKYDSYRLDDIPSRPDLDQIGYDLKKEIRLYGDIEKLLSALRTKGVDIKTIKEEKLEIDKLGGLIPVSVKAKIDRTIARGICKILFNYLAKNLHKSIIMKDDFDPIRQYIRFDIGNQDDFFMANNKPIPIQVFGTPGKPRWLPGHLMTADRQDQEIFGGLSIYGSIIKISYKVTFCGAYKGIWFPLTVGHYFDPIDRIITPLMPIKLTLA